MAGKLCRYAAGTAAVCAVLLLVYMGVRSAPPPMRYVERATGLTLRDICVSTEGTVEVSLFEECGIVRFTLRDGGTEEVVRQMDELGIQRFDELPIPPCSGNEISRIAQKEKITAAYIMFRTEMVPFGRARRDMDIFLTTDEDGTEHLYCFG